MAQSLCRIYVHLIFHIKSTSPPVRADDLERLHSYIGQLVNTTGCDEIQAGGVGDHVHVLFALSKECSLSHLVEEVKRNSSRWLKTLAPCYHNFAWQGGYAAFSVSQSVVDKTLQYIKRQGEHHKRRSFAEEYTALLDSYGIEYDRRYVFCRLTLLPFQGVVRLWPCDPGRCPGL